MPPHVSIVGNAQRSIVELQKLGRHIKASEEMCFD